MKGLADYLCLAIQLAFSEVLCIRAQAYTLQDPGFYAMAVRVQPLFWEKVLETGIGHYFPMRYKIKGHFLSAFSLCKCTAIKADIYVDSIRDYIFHVFLRSVRMYMSSLSPKLVFSCFNL